MPARSGDPYRELKAAHGRPARPPRRRAAALHDEMTRLARDALRAALDITRDEELDCDEVHEFLDVFAEMHAAGKDVRALLPLVYLHLQACGDCFEEFEALRRIVAAAR
ncbi:MAG: hypothetical protein OXQ31_01155 [Spirochaetaceae bacterium]|nr:hypothetical protein [Spirochaetaceae bacterium]